MANQSSMIRWSRLAVIACLLVSGASGVAGAADIPPTTARGANMLIKSQADPNFCIAVDAGIYSGRTITLQPCSDADTQRWAFTLNSDATNFIVESQGMCLNGNQPPADAGLPLTVSRCYTGYGRRFTFSPSGLIQNILNGKCLVIPGAASNVAVSLATCDESKKTQLWKLAH